MIYASGTFGTQFLILINLKLDFYPVKGIAYELWKISGDTSRVLMMATANNFKILFDGLLFLGILSNLRVSLLLLVRLPNFLSKEIGFLPGGWIWIISLNEISLLWYRYTHRYLLIYASGKVSLRFFVEIMYNGICPLRIKFFIFQRGL